MSMVTVYDAQGKQVGEVPLPPVLEAKPHTAVLHEALLWQLAGRRRGTHSTLSRGMVDRSTRKLYRQKGIITICGTTILSGLILDFINTGEWTIEKDYNSEYLAKSV